MIAYAEKSGHMDSDTVFCYECGTQSELHDGRYYCPKCKRFIDYRNRQKRKV
jgi:Zn finger protein HypA/HybF involved in hydrogenase expression